MALTTNSSWFLGCQSTTEARRSKPAALDTDPQDLLEAELRRIVRGPFAQFGIFLREFLVWRNETRMSENTVKNT